MGDEGGECKEEFVVGWRKLGGELCRVWVVDRVLEGNDGRKGVKYGC